jgi:hypothetical protein
VADNDDVMEVAAIPPEMPGPPPPDKGDRHWGDVPRISLPIFRRLRRNKTAQEPEPT